MQDPRSVQHSARLTLAEILFIRFKRKAFFFQNKRSSHSCDWSWSDQGASLFIVVYTGCAACCLTLTATTRQWSKHLSKIANVTHMLCAWVSFPRNSISRRHNPRRKRDRGIEPTPSLFNSTAIQYSLYGPLCSFVFPVVLAFAWIIAPLKNQGMQNETGVVVELYFQHGAELQLQCFRRCKAGPARWWGLLEDVQDLTLSSPSEIWRRGLLDHMSL